jgi:cytochrome c oxidase subunit 4
MHAAAHAKPTIFEPDANHVAPLASTLTTYVVLLVITAVVFAVGFSNLGPMKVFASLAVAAVQIAVLALFFMDLRYADKLTWLCVGAAVFWIMILFTFTLTDYLTRHLATY